MKKKLTIRIKTPFQCVTAGVIVGIILLILLLVVCFNVVGCSDVVNNIFGDVIDGEIDSDTIENFVVLPGSEDFKDISSTLVIDSTSGVTAVYEETSGKGYVFVSTTTGFSHMITVTVGVDLNGVITGIQVEMDSRDYTVNENTINSYIGKDSTLSGIEITTGATVSSNAVKRAVLNGFNVLAVNGLLKCDTNS